MREYALILILIYIPFIPDYLFSAVSLLLEVDHKQIFDEKLLFYTLE